MSQKLYVLLQGTPTAVPLTFSSSDTVFDLILTIKNEFDDLSTIHASKISVHPTAEGAHCLSDVLVEKLVQDFPSIRTASGALIVKFENQGNYAFIRTVFTLLHFSLC